MFKRFFRKTKDQYFFGLLMQCVKRMNKNDNSYNLVEATTLFFPQAERELNVDSAIAGNFPLNSAAMRYYANCARIQHERGNIDDDQYSNMILAQVDYLADCRRWDILRGIQRDLILDQFKESYAELIAEREAEDE